MRLYGLDPRRTFRPEQGSRRWDASLLAALIALALAAPAHASLGASRETVEGDRAHMAASRTSRAASAYTVDIMALANGGTVKEYSRADGTVFAVTWMGSGRPDLRQLLGSRFSTLQADNVRKGPRTRRPLSVNRTDIVVQSGGHSGAFWGVAILPGVAPAGFSAADIR
jgi:hypothetical protein